MQPGEPILLICHAFPPIFGIGGRRWAKFAKELARRGHPVHVIRSAKLPGAPDSLWSADVLHPNIHHHPLPARYPAVITRWPLTSLWDKLTYRFWLRALPFFTKGNYYDMGILSRKDLLRTASALIRKHGIRNVVATGAPFSYLTNAVELKEQHPTIHLVADFRDPWTWGKAYGQTSIGDRRMDEERRKEALVAHTADKLITPSFAMMDHLQHSYQGDAARYAVIPHAIDPDECDLQGSRPSDGTFRMIYAGSLYERKETDHYFDRLIGVFLQLQGKSDHKLHLDLFITGPGTADLRRKVHANGLQEEITFHDPAPPREVLSQIANSDLVLAFIPRDRKDIMVTKLSEIFYLRKPVLHVGEPGLVSRTITERRLGATLRVEELAAELPRIISGERKIEIDMEADHSEFLLANITDRLISEVLV